MLTTTTLKIKHDPSAVLWSDRIDAVRLPSDMNKKVFRKKLKTAKSSVSQIEVIVKRVSSPMTQALDNYVEYHSNIRKDMIITKIPALPKQILERITVNFIKHHLSSYRNNLQELLNKNDKTLHYIVLNSKVYKKIAETYPRLTTECARQFVRKAEVAGLVSIPQELMVSV